MLDLMSTFNDVFSKALKPFGRIMIRKMAKYKHYYNRKLKNK